VEARTLGQVVAPTHQRLWALARNLWWSWDQDATSLFATIDPAMWRDTGHNPIALLHNISIEKIEERVSDLGLHSRIHYAHRRMREYLSATRTWGDRHKGCRPMSVRRNLASDDSYQRAEAGIGSAVSARGD